MKFVVYRDYVRKNDPLDFCFLLSDCNWKTRWQWIIILLINVKCKFSESTISAQINTRIWWIWRKTSSVILRQLDAWSAMQSTTGDSRAKSWESFSTEAEHAIWYRSDIPNWRSIRIYQDKATAKSWEPFSTLIICNIKSKKSSKLRKGRKRKLLNLDTK